MFKKAILIPLREYKVRQIRRPNLTPEGRDVIDKEKKIINICRCKNKTRVNSLNDKMVTVADSVNLLMLYLKTGDFYAPKKGHIIAIAAVTARILAGTILSIWLGDDIVYHVKGKKIVEYMHKESLWLNQRLLHPLKDS